MTLDTITFFEIALSGFMTMWIFRHFTKNDKKMAEFEWLGLSVFWGLLIMTLLSGLNSLKPYPNMQEFLSNPLATGLGTSIIGIVIGFFGAQVNKFFK